MTVTRFQIGQTYKRNGLSYKVIKLTNKSIWVEELSSQFGRPEPKVSRFLIKELYDTQFFVNRLGLHVYACLSYSVA